MPSVINTNIPSLNTQRNLSASQTSLNTTIQRLSSGLRVNSAKDDAAGLAIAERMNAQVRGLNVAARNANDGVSLAQTAEGALGKVGDMVQRMRELAVQSSNATNSVTDRAALQQEVLQLRQEVDRVAATTNFNGTKLLDGSFTAAVFQVGANAGEGITIAGITDARLSGMGAFYETAPVAAPADPVAPATLAATSFTLNGTTIDIKDTAATGAQRLKQIADAINQSTMSTGAVASIDAGGKLVLQSTSAIRLDVTAGAATATGLAAGTPSADSAATVTAGNDMSKLNVSTFAGAQLAIEQADAALTQINSARAQLGAVQSRFESAVSNIQIAAENTTAARSRIMDTDFAAETANLARAQILQQAGNAMLSQANQLPQQVLSLLRN